MNKFLKWGSVIVASITGATFFLVDKLSGKKEFSNLKHCKVPDQWEKIKEEAWLKSSSVLGKISFATKTKLNKIEIEAGIKINPKTEQWGRSTLIDGEEFWYAGLSNGKRLKIVGDLNKNPYDKSLAIMTHEVAESILDMDFIWKTKTPEERNKFLWSIGL